MQSTSHSTTSREHPETLSSFHVYVIISTFLLILTGSASRILGPASALNFTIPTVATDPESSFAFGHSLPVDLPPEDLLEEIRGVPSRVVQALLVTAKEYCAISPETRPEWKWEQTRGVGDKRAEILRKFLQPPSCMRSNYTRLPQ